MDVDIEHGDAGVPAAQPLGGDGGVVQEAEAARHVGIGVMAGRPAERVGLAAPSSTRSAALAATSLEASAASQVCGPIGQARST